MAGIDPTHKQAESRCRNCDGVIFTTEEGGNLPEVCSRCGAILISSVPASKIQPLPIPPLPSLHVKPAQVPAMQEPVGPAPAVATDAVARVEDLAAAKPPPGAAISPFPAIPVAMPVRSSSQAANGPSKDGGIRIGVLPLSSKATSPAFNRVASDPGSEPGGGPEPAQPNPAGEVSPHPDRGPSVPKRQRIGERRSKPAKKRWAVVMILLLLLILIVTVAIAAFISAGGAGFLGVKLAELHGPNGSVILPGASAAGMLCHFKSTHS
jgi:hypothetical protein